MVESSISVILEGPAGPSRSLDKDEVKRLWEAEGLRIPLTGFDVAEAGEDLASLSSLRYSDASLYSVCADHSTFLRSRLEPAPERVMSEDAGELFAVGGVCRL